MDKAAPDPLQAIRTRIDAIDEEMHALLIERSGVIAELIEIKGTSRPGGAFRPDREADMMRRLALRHKGSLPLATVEHIWREIITTFTAMQAPFGIAAGPARDVRAMRDVIRFYFGFSVPIADCGSAARGDRARRAAGTECRDRGGGRGRAMVGRPFQSRRAESLRKTALPRNPRSSRPHDRLCRRAAARRQPGLRYAALRHVRHGTAAAGDPLAWRQRRRPRRIATARRVARRRDDRRSRAGSRACA